MPDELSSYEEAAELWDEHDTTDYPDAFVVEGEIVEAEQLGRALSPRPKTRLRP